MESDMSITMVWHQYIPDCTVLLICVHCMVQSNNIKTTKCTTKSNKEKFKVHKLLK